MFLNSKNRLIDDKGNNNLPIRQTERTRTLSKCLKSNYSGFHYDTIFRIKDTDYLLCGKTVIINKDIVSFTCKTPYQYYKEIIRKLSYLKEQPDVLSSHPAVPTISLQLFRSDSQASRGTDCGCSSPPPCLHNCLSAQLYHPDDGNLPNYP